jgi:hypothetical protein
MATAPGNQRNPRASVAEQYLVAVLRMPSEFGDLVAAQLAPLVQQLDVDAHLADDVHQPGQPHLADSAAVETQLIAQCDHQGAAQSACTSRPFKYSPSG